MDLAFALLQPYLRNGPQACLLVADENLGDAPFNTIAPQVEVISNRFDISRCAQAAGLKAQFNDFDFSGYPVNHFTRLCYRISKEKAVVEHVLDQASKVLEVEGQLILCGGKNEGLKRFANYAAKLMDSSAEIRKTGTLYTACIVKQRDKPDARAPADNYGRSLPIEVDMEVLGLAPLHGQTSVTLHSKAGMFGAGKIDEGSAMLAASLPAFFAGFNNPPCNLLDLGCGFGYLSICASGFGLENIVATDNCAAAIETCKQNATSLGLPIEVIADDCAGSIREQFDAVLCNPPFHQGFTVSSALGERFLRAAAGHLNPQGQALFVVNQFIPLENLAARYFENIDVVARNPSFKLVAFSKPGPGRQSG